MRMSLSGGCALLAIAVSAAAGGAERLAPPKDVSLCEVMASPAVYDLKPVRLTVRIEQETDGRLILRAAACPYAPLVLGKPYHAADTKSLLRLKEAVTRLYAVDRHSQHFAAKATLIGVFDMQGAYSEPALLPLNASGVSLIPTTFWNIS